MTEEKSHRSAFNLHGQWAAFVKIVDQKFPKEVPLEKNVNLPLSDGCKKVLHLALEEAAALHHARIEPEHLVLGLLRDEECLPARFLRSIGMEIESARFKASEALPAESISLMAIVAAITASVFGMWVVFLILRAWF
jgi:ClpA/ClpB-like protein